ncbi:Uncharacterised protein [Staphylococcus cohnii subsp. cohnii]|nr:Uncharacterised protein [Staphylococcus cohnii subsp. cohnii]
MEKVKNFFNKFKWYILAGLVLLIIIIVVITLLVKNHKVSVEDDVKVNFEGYNKSGTAEITDDSYDKVMNKLTVRALKQSGFKNKEVIEKIKNNNDEDIDIDDFNYDQQKKIEHAKKIMEHVDFDIYNDNNLKNGDKAKVKLEIDKGSSKDYQLKAKEFTKEFKAHGLKEPKTLTAKSLIKALNPKFTGINGSGSLNLVDKNTPKSLKELSLSDYNFTVPNNGELKNGDSVKITIPQDLIDDINENGSNVFKGEKVFNTKVKGLADLNKVKNLNDMVERNNKLVNEENKSTKYTKYKNEPLDNYYKVNYESSDNSYFDSDKEEISEKVSPSATVDPAYITLVTSYKITKTFDDEDADVNYTYKGYEDYTLENNRLVKDDENDEVNNSSSADKLSELNDNLESEGFSKVQ